MDTLSRAVTEALFWRMSYQEAFPDVSDLHNARDVLGHLLKQINIDKKEVSEGAILSEWRDRVCWPSLMAI